MTRLLSVKNEILKRNLDAVLISSISNIIYLTDFSHFSKEEREAFLLVTLDKCYILTDGRYSEAAAKKVKGFELIEISPRQTLEKVLKGLAKKHKIKRVGLDHHNITFAEHKKLSNCFNDLNHFSIDKLRAIKTAHEILNIEKACKLTDKTFKHILNKIKLGVSEKQLAFEIELFIKRKGADISFPPIVAIGANSSIPHHVPTNNKLTNNQIVLVDFGAKVNNYCSDMTRTVFFGKASNKHKRIYQTVLAAQQKAIGSLANKVPPLQGWNLAKKIDKAARDYIVSQGYPIIPHSLGHGIGLEVHEAPHLSPKSKDILKPKMVFSIEPGIYIPNFGGVRIEDLFVLGKSELKLLTLSSKDIIEL